VRPGSLILTVGNAVVATARSVQEVVCNPSAVLAEGENAEAYVTQPTSSSFRDGLEQQDERA